GGEVARKALFDRSPIVRVRLVELGRQQHEEVVTKEIYGRQLFARAVQRLKDPMCIITRVSQNLNHFEARSRRSQKRGEIKTLGRPQRRDPLTEVPISQRRESRRVVLP